ncbi:MAG: DHH family phosphoesterase [Gammaproteobacteria bacterium]|nr:DHH family phosphoesterase [Gammaproteobacteria bacterium]MCF6231041.1 DHH family phosphoesterase [Gammaproteobacteria bacterium]
MSFFDVFNGDADGICALQQWRLANPEKSSRVTGVKRDISLLKRVNATSGDQVAVFDISLDKNRDALNTLLAQGVNIIYFDHHFAGEIPAHDNFEVKIDTSAETCTSLLVNHYLKAAFPRWAIVGAFGDNLVATAEKMAAGIGLNEEDTAQLKQLGECMNYNGYGASLDDLHVTPQALSEELSVYQDPLEFIADENSSYQKLLKGYQEDLAQAASVQPFECDSQVALYHLPNQAWARRVSGVFANQLATENPGRAHAMLTEKANGHYLVSVRAPLNRKEGADQLCLQFETGGGRKAAAGINDLPADQVESFTRKFREAYALRPVHEK